MDSLTTAAALALASGDPLAALARVALREDPPALALRGTALAQLGAFDEARALLRRAARGFGPHAEVSRARCLVAEAEVALAARDLGHATPLKDARAVLERHGDTANAAYVRLIEARWFLMEGRLDAAAAELAALSLAALPPALGAVHALVEAGIAVRHVRAGDAAVALERARRTARAAAIPALAREVEAAAATLAAPAARLIAGGAARTLCLAEVEALAGTPELIVDACRFVVRQGGVSVNLTRRPILFALARALAEAGAGGATREALLTQAFGARHADESHRARLRVEIGRLRKVLHALAAIVATPGGFVLTPHAERKVWVLTAMVEDRNAAALALLADGEAWSSSALARALGASQRQAQRTLEALARAGKAQALGRGRARRWTTPPLPGIATALLLPPPLPAG